MQCLSQQFTKLKSLRSIICIKRYLLTSLVGAGVGGGVGGSVGAGVGTLVGAPVGWDVGLFVGWDVEKEKG